MGLGDNNISKGLKGYRYQEIELDGNDDSYDPGEVVTIDYAKYKTYIDRIAKRFYKKLAPNSRWDLDEIKQEAWLALVECNERYYNSHYSDKLKAFAYPYIVKRLSEFMSVNMYTLKVRYYNIKEHEDKLARANWLERTLWSESKYSNDGGDEAEENPMLSKPSGIESTADEAAKKEEQDIVKEIVNSKLPKEERRAIVRRFRNGDTYREIGERLNVSPETARKMVKRGLKKIEQGAKDAGINSN